MKSMAGFVIGALVVAVAVLGYLYYQERRDNVGVKIDPPNVKIEKNEQ